MKFWKNRGKQIYQLPNSDGYLDRREFLYIMAIDRIFQKISKTPGHIVEVGVARGRNAILFGHLVSLSNPDASRHYYGFDTFDGFVEEDLKQNKHLDENRWKISREFVEERIRALKLDKVCHLFDGDIRETGPKFLDSGISGHTPGNFRCALLYIDCNAYGAAKEAMRIFRPHMTPGGIVCIDEKTQGGETEALVEFCREEGLSIKRDSDPFSIPAYTEFPLHT